MRMAMPGLHSQARSSCCWILRLLCFSALLNALGCQFAPIKSTSDWPWKNVKTRTIPDRILPVWTDSVLHQPGQTGIRGFGGRVYFYGKQNSAPVEVDGNFAVYVFDADDNTIAEQKPLRKFVFTADQFQSHMSKTSMGPSYSVWIPWGEVGGQARRLSLISRFEGRDGGTTISDPTIKMLPGIPSNKEVAVGPTVSTIPNSSTSVSLAGHTEVSSKAQKKEEPEVKDGLDSIDLPPAFQRHLRAPTTQSETPAAKQPADDTTTSQQHQEIGTPSSRAADSGIKTAAPATTQVYDYRSRGRVPFSGPLSKKPTKSDIREGRWIQSIPRTNKSE